MHSDEFCSHTSEYLPYTCHANHVESIGYHARWRATARHGRVNQIGRTSIDIRFLSCSVINKLTLLGKHNHEWLKNANVFGWSLDHSSLQMGYASIVLCEPCDDREIRLNFIWPRYVYRCLHELQRFSEDRQYVIRRMKLSVIFDDKMKMSDINPSSTGAGILSSIHPQGAERNTGMRDQIPASSMFPAGMLTVGGSYECYHDVCECSSMMYIKEHRVESCIKHRVESCIKEDWPLTRTVACFIAMFLYPIRFLINCHIWGR